VVKVSDEMQAIVTETTRLILPPKPKEAPWMWLVSTSSSRVRETPTEADSSKSLRQDIAPSFPRWESGGQAETAWSSRRDATAIADRGKGKLLYVSQTAQDVFLPWGQALLGNGLAPSGQGSLRIVCGVICDQGRSDHGLLRQLAR
jgi:hypothetical protein